MSTDQSCQAWKPSCLAAASIALAEPHLAPFRALVESPQQLEQRLRGYLEHVPAAGLMDLRQGCHSICHYHRIAVSQQVLRVYKLSCQKKLAHGSLYLDVRFCNTKMLAESKQTVPEVTLLEKSRSTA